jgi:hypothetical protein
LPPIAPGDRVGAIQRAAWSARDLHALDIVEQYIAKRDRGIHETLIQRYAIHQNEHARGDAAHRDRGAVPVVTRQIIGAHRLQQFSKIRNACALDLLV